MDPFSFPIIPWGSNRSRRGSNFRGSRSRRENRGGKGANQIRFFENEMKEKEFEEIKNEKEGKVERERFTNSRGNTRNNMNYLTSEDLNNMMSMSLEKLVPFMQKLQPWKERLDRTHSLAKYIDFLLEILVKICGLENETLYLVRDFFESTNFAVELNRKLRDVSGILCSSKDLNGVPKIIKNLHLIYSTSIKHFRSDLRYFDPKDIIECIELIRDIKKNEGWNGLDMILPQFKEIHAVIKSVQLEFTMKKIDQKAKKENVIEKNIRITYKEDDFHPSFNDVMNPRKKDLIFPHIMSGSYPSLEIYLNNMFYLLKEDFVSGLRDGLLEFKKGERLQNVYFYNDVRLGSICFGDSALFIKINLRPVALKNGRPQPINWFSTKRLTFGALMVLTNRNLDDMYFVTIQEKPDPKFLIKKYQRTGYCEVSVRGMKAYDEEMNLRLRRIGEKGLIAFESKTFFEAYSHCLEKIQKIDLNNFPFTRQIIDCDLKMLSYPFYLENSNKCFYLNTNFEEFIENLVGRYNLKLFDPEWPISLKGSLDDSQYNALKLMLTQDLAIVQGPPGTGKTYVGALAVKALLENSHIWRQGRNRPLTILAYTNHALDQFLGHISKFTNSIARLGGRCNDPNIMKFSLTQLRKDARENGGGYIKDFRTFKETIEKLERVYSGFDPSNILSWHNFEKYMPADISERFASEFKDCMKIYGVAFLYQLNKNSLKLLFRSWLLNEELTESLICKVCELESSDGNKLIPVEHINIRKGIPLEEKPQEEFKKEGEVLEEEVEDPHEEENRMLELMTEERKIFNERDDEINVDNQISSQTVSTSSLLPPSSLYSNNNIWNMTKSQKQELVNYCKTLAKNKNLTFYEKLLNDYKNLMVRVQMENIKKDLEILKSKKIVGMTITGSAKYAKHLEGLESPITIIEEAAEVLESHTISVLTKFTEHLILIGDHQQLRPKIEDYGLGKNFNFNISLFERMVKNGINLAVLEYQRRMRPEFADFIRIIYESKEYKDHDAVLNYKNVRGIRGNLVYFNHHHLETENIGLKSKKNEFEANMIVHLTNYFIQQNYKPDQITILAMYVGQTLQIKNLLKQMKIEVKVATIDNYQGEENDIIIVSLVRSNKENKLGFTKDPNRICVSLSRARLGLYIFGNFDCLRQGTKGGDLWKKIIALAEEKKVLSNQLILACQNHENICEITNVESFKNVPEGGCKLICNSRKECGHICKIFCHNTEEHFRRKCRERCDNINPTCGHKCSKLCNESCGYCLMPILQQLKCGHSQSSPCYVPIDDIVCLNQCERILPCGHRCGNLCSAECNDKSCKVKIKKSLVCGHVTEIACSKDVKLGTCPVPCLTILSCGHKCPGNCSKCFEGTLHVRCQKKCQKILICGHECQGLCGENCPPCKRKCDYQCCEAKCTLLCGEKCYPCKAPCRYECPHSKCKLLCMEICDRKCDLPCSKMNEICGHPCIGVCGEKCPKLCRLCQKNHEIFNIFFGEEDVEDARFYELQCGHIFEVNGLDKYMDLENQKRNGAVKYIGCPKCRTKITKSNRYQQYIKETLFDINVIKEKIINFYLVTEGDLITLNNRNTEVKLKISKKQHLLTMQETKKKLNDYVKTMNEEINYFIKQKDKYLRRKEYDSLLNHVNLIEDYLELLHYALDSKTNLASYEASLFESQVVSLGKFYLFDYESKYDGLFWRDIKRKLDSLIYYKEYHLLERMRDSAGIKAGKSKIFSTKFYLSDEALEFHKNILISFQIPTRQEQIDVIKVLNLTAGHVYKCPNGHYYVIGECGGAMEESVCIECKAAVGGHNHNLTTGNSHTGDLDGSTYAAYSQGAQEALIQNIINEQGLN